MNGVAQRHLGLVPRGEPYLIVAHRPFDGLNPYTETGPIFVSATEGAGSEQGPVPGPEPPWPGPELMMQPELKQPPLPLPRLHRQRH
mgnify:CR=1 FL=1